MRADDGGWILLRGMSLPSLISRGATRDRSRTAPRMRRIVAWTPDLAKVARQPVPAPDLDSIAAQWKVALDAAERALVAAGDSLPSAELMRRRRQLVQERQHTAETLMRLAKARGVRPAREAPGG
jgi:hypothetical protein